MPDWQELVRKHLSGLAFDAAEKDDVHAELAAHLQENCEELRRQGMTEEEAVQRTLSQAGDWQELRRKIQSSRTKENIMTNRVRQFWLPSLLTLLFTMGLLALIQIFGPNPWTVARKTNWSLIAPAAVVYLPWLLSLPVVGAMAAYLSIRAGGSRRAVFSSILFPVLPYLVFFLVGVPVIAIFNDRVAHNFMIPVYFVGLFAWVLAPGVALLTGGFLVQLFVSPRLASRGIAGH